MTLDETTGDTTALDILEDYIVQGRGRLGAIVHREAPEKFARGVAAAAISCGLGIGLAYAHDRYASDREAPRLPAAWICFQDVYFAGRDHIEETRQRPQPSVEPRAGEVFASVALQRVTASYYAAGLLFRTGFLFEARAIARLFLEQVAWAYAVLPATDADAASRMRG